MSGMWENLNLFNVRGW